MAPVSGREGPVERSLFYAAFCSFSVLVLLLITGRIATGTFDGLDAVPLRWLRHLTGDSGFIITLARDVTALGNDVTLWTVSLVAIGYLAAGRYWSQIVHLAGTTALGGLATTAIKALVDRPRPDVVMRLVDVHSASFPSGHAMNTAFVFGTLGLIVARHSASVRQQWYVAATVLMLVVLIGTSRLVLGVHWPTDVLTGWVIGWAWTLLAGGFFAGRSSSFRRPLNDRYIR